ncbi:MAG: TrmH family RNA methyltransferase [Bacteroidota bacterium]
MDLKGKSKYLNLRTFFQNLDPVIPVFGTFLEGENIYNCNLENRAILLVGSEAHGISDEVQPLVTKRIHIPSYNTDVNYRKGAPESLNASVATAIACAEFRRRLLQ